MRFSAKEINGKWRIVNRANITIASSESGKSIDRGGYSSKEECEEHTELLNGYAQECYAGPDDPRLPSDVQAMTIGKREDFVDTFNCCFYWYWKEDDDQYDENQTKAVNCVNYANRMAYAKIADDGEDGAMETERRKNKLSAAAREALSNPDVVRIRETFVGAFPVDSLKESVGDGGFDVKDAILISVGWSLNERYYSENAVKDVARLANEKVVGYMNHGDTYGRDPRDWSIVIEDAKFKEGKAVGSLHIFEYPDGPMLRERIEYAKSNKGGHLFGLSIDSWVRQSSGEAEGKKGPIVNEVIELNSVDIVMVPAAGGRVVRESVDNSNPREKSAMDIETLKKEHPDLVAAIVEEVKAELAADFDLKKAELEAHIEQKDATIQEQKQALENIEKTRIEKEQRDQFEAAVNAEVACLPEEVRTAEYVKSLIDLGQDKMESIKSLVAEAKKIADKLQESGSISGQGVKPDGQPTVDPNAAKEARRKMLEKRCKKPKK